MLKTYTANAQLKASGFSLIEMAVVMVIVSTLLGGLLLSLSQVRESNDRSDTDKILSQITDALYGFAQANGRLPCPATTTSVGAEARNAGPTFLCTRQYGFVPWATLGLSGPINADSLLVDSWLSPYRYNVTTQNGQAFTRTGQMQATGITALLPNLQICSASACGAGNVLVNSAPAVIVSLGANFATFTSADERANSGEANRNGYRHANNLNFVSARYDETNFDDMITWLSPNILYTKMIAAGQLP